MPNYYNYMTGEDEDISTAKAFYVICLNPGLQTYKFCASPVELNQLPFDPMTRATQYWPITTQQMDNADQAMWVFGDNVRTAPFSIDQIQSCFGFDPNTTPARGFGQQAQASAEPTQRFRDEMRAERSQVPAGSRVLEDGTIQTRQMRIELVVNLSRGLFTAEDIGDMHGEAITSLTFLGCIDAVREHVLSLDDIKQMGGDAFFKLTPECIGALREGLFSVTDITDKDSNFIHALTRDTCLDALREGRADIQQLKDMSAGELYTANRIGDYPHSPRLGM